MENMLNKIKLGITFKTSLVCCIVIIVLLSISSLISINLQSSFSNVTIETYSVSQAQMLKVYEEKQTQSLKAISQANTEIFSGIASPFVYNFDQDNLGAMLKSFMKLPNIDAIIILDAGKQPFSAVWRTPEITTGIQLPDDVSPKQEHSILLPIHYKNEVIGSVQLFYTDKLLIQEINNKKEGINKSIKNFQTIAKKSINKLNFRCKKGIRYQA